MINRIGGSISVPKANSVAQYMQHIEVLPAVDAPELFGLHDNATLVADRTSATTMFAKLSALSRVSNATSSTINEDHVKSLVSMILSRIPANISVVEVKSKHPISHSDTMSVVVNREVVYYNQLLDRVRRSLDDLYRATMGLKEVSDTIEKTKRNILDGVVPKHWQSYTSDKALLPWIDDLIKRVSTLTLWVTGSNPVVYWLGGLYDASGFIAAIKQDHARREKVAIDTLTIFATVTKTMPTSPPSSGVYVSGLFVEGAVWDLSQNALVEAKTGELVKEMPVIWLQARTAVEEDKGSRKSEYQCPIYRTLNRKGLVSTSGESDNYLISIDLPTSKPEKYWILRRTALFLSLN